MKSESEGQICQFTRLTGPLRKKRPKDKNGALKREILISRAEFEERGRGLNLSLEFKIE